MKIVLKTGRQSAAFSMIEVLMTSVILGIMFTSMYAGMSSGFTAVNLARENLRAAQILTEKVEEFRTYSWSEVTSGGTNIPATFLAYFFPTNMSGSTNIDAANSGIIYTGAVTIANSGLTESYNTDLKLVTVGLTWRSSGAVRTRTMKTYVSQYGMRNYLY